MNELIKQGLIIEKKGTQNVQYIFNEKETFSLTEYKVLRSQNKNFAKCSKVLFNGKVKLVYFTGNYKSLRSMLNSIDFDTFLSILSNVFSCMIEIKNNGFLSCNDLDLDFEKIFIDQNTLEVFLVYLPITDSSTDVLSFENEFRSEVIKLINTVPAFAGEKAGRVCNYFSNGNVTIEQLYQSVRSEINSFVKGKNPSVHPGGGGVMPPNSNPQPVMTISALNAPVPKRLSVNRPEFIIGKNPAKVHGVIDFNPAVSRIHCKINFESGEYYITDLGSANGTFVNSKKLAPQIPKLLTSGCVIRLANSDFKIEF